MSPTHLRVEVARLERWVENFGGRHGPTRLGVADGALTGVAEDTSSFEARLPFGRAYAGTADLADFAQQCAAPPDWGVLLVRKGGFAIARLTGEQMQASKVGQRHVQGRTKAGGQSQQRFARRRGEQARVAYEAAAGHAARILLDPPVPVLVAGGDQNAVDAVVADRRLSVLLPGLVTERLTVPDPRRSVLDAAVAEACSISLSVVNA